MMVFDAVLYAVLAWYLDNVFPGWAANLLYDLLNSILSLYSYYRCITMRIISYSSFTGQYGIGRPFYFPFQPSYWQSPAPSHTEKADQGQYRRL